MLLLSDENGSLSGCGAEIIRPMFQDLLDMPEGLIESPSRMSAIARW